MSTEQSPAVALSEPSDGRSLVDTFQVGVAAGTPTQNDSILVEPSRSR